MDDDTAEERDVGGPVHMQQPRGVHQVLEDHISGDLGQPEQVGDLAVPHPAQQPVAQQALLDVVRVEVDVEHAAGQLGLEGGERPARRRRMGLPRPPDLADRPIGAQADVRHGERDVAAAPVTPGRVLLRGGQAGPAEEDHPGEAGQVERAPPVLL